MTTWRWWGNCYAMAIWLYILMNANWKDGYWHGVECKRGEFITSKSKIAAELGIDRRTVTHWLNAFEKDGQIAVTCTTQYTTITVIKYDIFQGQTLSIAQPNVQPDVQPDVQRNVQPDVHNIRSKEIKNSKKERIESKSLTPPTIFEVREFFFNEGYDSDPEDFYQYNEARKWKDKAGNIVDWKVKASDWERHEKKFSSSQSDIKVPVPDWWPEE